MPQFFVPKKNIQNRNLTFEPSESYHLINVLRKKIGDIIQIFDGEGFVSHVKLSEVSNPGQAKAEILSVEEPAGGQLALRVFPALLKAERFEWLLEKLTELGVYSICPIFTDRTIVKIKPEQTDKKLRRWNNTVLSAAKQCGRTKLPEVFEPKTFREVLQDIKDDEKSFILWEGEDQKDLSEALSGLKCPQINLLIGPEGGFVLDEIAAAKQSKVISVRLGKNILRAETAAMAAASLILLTKNPA